MPAMPESDDSPLWRVSEFEQQRIQTTTAGFNRPDGPTLLPTTLLADLTRLQADQSTNDVIEVIAACMRHKEAALLCFLYEDLVWPVTLFPSHYLYHSPRDIAHSNSRGLGAVSLLSADPPGVRPPGHWMHERVADTSQYRPLGRLLWTMAMYGPRSDLLHEIAGRAAYRLVPSRLAEPLDTHGALGPAVQRLQRESVSLRELATWPGLSVDRASRLLNALYLNGGLMVTRSHPAARNQPGFLRSWFGGRR
jgi:hypothetical protein